ncbi:NlpC/P60 family protein [Amycolatopsis pigmentata]|uniref:NlpC/P60 family protein n=1 Tax=Amycolatopsis pigmentata TaxID=450801 RepID=A0ABW5FQV7_9PSEU
MAAVRGLIVGTMVTVVAALGAAGTCAAVPPPPPNPSDAEIDSGRAAADGKAGEVGELTSRVARAEARLAELRAASELKRERANKAMVDLVAAQDAANASADDAAAARKESGAADAQAEVARGELDRFVTASFEQGSMIGSIAAFLGSPSPQDLLDRVELLSAVGRGRNDAVRTMDQASTDKANKDAAARASLRTARQRQDEAAQAQRDADAARDEAERADQDQVAETARLESERDTAERQLFAAQQRVDGLRDQRRAYDDWVARQQSEEQQAIRLVSAKTGGGKTDNAPSVAAPAAPPGSSPLVERVVSRALAQVGKPYAWGGGNSNGATRGIRDGGVADRYGDYNKIGFDCSGLMVYAFAGVATLPHYAGYQYNAGRHVPLAQMRRGDMLFWGVREIHHVALYLGNGVMVEAPESGKTVRVTPVRYADIVPFATRVVG